MINEQWVESFGRTSSASNKSQWSCEPHDPQQLNMGFIVTLLLAMVKTFVFLFMQFENAICKAHVDVLLSPYIWPTFQCPTYMRVFMITALLVLLMIMITMFIRKKIMIVIMRMMLAGKGKRRENWGQMSGRWIVQPHAAADMMIMVIIGICTHSSWWYWWWNNYGRCDEYDD